MRSSLCVAFCALEPPSVPAAFVEITGAEQGSLDAAHNLSLLPFCLFLFHFENLPSVQCPLPSVPALGIVSLPLWYPKWSSQGPDVPTLGYLGFQ